MALEEYKRKRDFKKTPEPPPGMVRGHKRKLSYLIQKHDATRLHYDFRLELDGVLLSWAVTKGPSLNPADKRLAVRTEDHPLSYGTFEGTIPKGQYGGGTVMLWDEGSWEPKGDPHAGLKKGHLSFTLHGGRLQGGWGLIRMHTKDKRENWLLIKEDDDEAHPGGDNAEFLDDLSYSVKSGRSMDEIAAGLKKTPKADKMIKKLLQEYSAPQLATLVDKPPEGEKWVHEIKFDGYRLLGFVADGEVMLRTRNGNDWTAEFPSIAAALGKLKVKEAVLDMEAVVLSAEGKSSFHALKEALSDTGDAHAIIAYAFDLLHLDGKDLTGLKLTERKKKLQALLKKPKQNALQYSEHVSGHGDEMIVKSCGLGLEGIISKRADAPYSPGRGKSWLKSKCIQRQEFIILGYSTAKKGSRAMGALYLGYWKGKQLHYAGKVGTGFTMTEAADIVEQLEKLRSAKPVLTRAELGNLLPGEISRIKWVKPELLCEVAFTEWTADNHIRHPSFQGLREDKDAASVKKEKPIAVKKIAKMAKPETEALVLHGVTITHPERVISEIGHVTKGDLAEYYAAVAPLILPHIINRPLSLLRCPGGIDGECFYQRNPGMGLGEDVYPFKFNHKGKKYEYLFIKNAKGLMELIQMGSIEIHPWGAKTSKIDYPDRLIFDLDPAPDVPFEAVKLAALDLRTRLENEGYEPYLKCTGGKGLHVIAPLNSKKKWPEVKEFAAALAHDMVEAAPEAYIATMSKAKRNGKIFIDFFRNDYTATAIADYAVRARPGAPVAVPLEWGELKRLKAGNEFTMEKALKKFKKAGLI